jgi:hypothetical protein
MLGEQYAELRGKITGQRVLDVDQDHEVDNIIDTAIDLSKIQKQELQM